MAASHVENARPNLSRDDRPGGKAQVEVRIARSTVALFSLMFLPLIFWSASVAWYKAEAAKASLIAVAYSLLVYWTCSPTIRLAPGRIIYKALFIRRDIDLCMIRRVFAVANPAPSLVFSPKEKGKRSTGFMIKPFSKNGIVAVLRHIRQCNPSVRFDAATEAMSQADFESITREAIAARNLMRVALTIGLTTFGACLIKAFLHQ